MTVRQTESVSHNPRSGGISMSSNTSARWDLVLHVSRLGLIGSQTVVLLDVKLSYKYIFLFSALTLTVPAAEPSDERRHFNLRRLIGPWFKIWINFMSWTNKTFLEMTITRLLVFLIFHFIRIRADTWYVRGLKVDSQSRGGRNNIEFCKSNKM